jgi:hypothetical protein
VRCAAFGFSGCLGFWCAAADQNCRLLAQHDCKARNGRLYGRLYVLQGGDLRKAWLRNEGLYAWGARGRAIALDIACGLQFLHSRGIIHRWAPQGVQARDEHC